MIARAAALAACAAACGGAARPAPVAVVAPQTRAERMLAILPDGAQLVIELDLARLRGNAVVGDLATRALARFGAETHLPGLPLAVAGSPLANADVVVLAAYGVGTADAATLTVLATTADVPGGHRIARDLVALGPEAWVGQLETRAAIAGAHPLAVPAEWLALRAHAMPKGATGAVVRVTARLPFDARVALARMTGLDVAPARLSLWADVADDLAVVVDADATDPGDRAGKDAARRLAHAIRLGLAELAGVPEVRALGVTTSLDDARLVAQGTWVRAIVAVGPHHLARVVERARAMLAPPP